MLTVAELARELDGTVEGDSTATVRGLAGLADAGEGDVTFLANPRYAAMVATTRASAVIVAGDWQGECACAVIRVKNADWAFMRAATLLSPPMPRPAPGLHPTAIVADDVHLGADAHIGPYCVVEPGVVLGDRVVLMAFCYVGADCRVGDDGLLYPHVSLRERTCLGQRVTVHNGAVIGSDGFGYVMHEGAWRKIPQVGCVEVGDDVEIGANVTIDRARFGKTVIGNGVKIDNLVQIAHNVKIGNHTAMAAQVGISGSASIGSYVMIGGQAGMAGHLHIGDQAIVAGRSGVTKDVAPKLYVSDYPAMPHRTAARLHAEVKKLPELKARVRELERRLQALENGNAGGSE